MVFDHPHMVIAKILPSNPEPHIFFMIKLCGSGLDRNKSRVWGQMAVAPYIEGILSSIEKSRVWGQMAK